MQLVRAHATEVCRELRDRPLKPDEIVATCIDERVCFFLSLIRLLRSAELTKPDHGGQKRRRAFGFRPLDSSTKLGSGERPHDRFLKSTQAEESACSRGG